MPYVEFYKLQNDGSQKVAAACTLDPRGEVTCDSKALMEDFSKNGIRDFGDPKHTHRLYPKDGLRFLENLKYSFSSGYLNASEVKESRGS